MFGTDVLIADTEIRKEILYIEEKLICYKFHLVGRLNRLLNQNTFLLITYGAKLLNADWHGWDRVHFFLISRALLVIRRAWLLDVLSWLPASNGFWMGISEAYRFWVWSIIICHLSIILTWKKIDTQQSAVLWWKSKMIFPSKNVSIHSPWKKFQWGRLVSHGA